MFLKKRVSYILLVVAIFFLFNYCKFGKMSIFKAQSKGVGQMQIDFTICINPLFIIEKTSF